MTLVECDPESTGVSVLRNETSEVRVFSEYGFNCYSWRWNDGETSHEIFYSDPAFVSNRTRASGNGTPILFPFPNRIAGGSFTHNGVTYRLPCNEKNGANAIHGFVLDRAWRASNRNGILCGEFQLSLDAPDLIPHWPSDFHIELQYALIADALKLTVVVTNPGSNPLPWGFGIHPYFRLPHNVSEEMSTVYLHADTQWELNECIPTGRTLDVSGSCDLRQGKSLGGLVLDDVLTDLTFEDGWSTCGYHDRESNIAMTMRFDEMFREAVVYTPPQRGAVCFEPYTCVTNAANLSEQGADVGWQLLEPGESTSGTIVMSMSRLNNNAS